MVELAVLGGFENTANSAAVCAITVSELFEFRISIPFSVAANSTHWLVA